MTIEGIYFLTSADGTHVFVRVLVIIAGKRHEVDFAHNVGHVVATRALRDALDKAFDDQIHAARRSEYNAGWRDAKARTAKRDWFSIGIEGKASDE